MENNEMINEAENNASEPAVEEQVANTHASKKSFPWWIVVVAAIAVVATVICCIIFGGGNKNPEFQDYTVSVVDQIGNPISAVMVKLIDANGKTSINITEKDGTVRFFDVPYGSCTVYVDKNLSNASFFKTEYHLAEGVNELKVVATDETKCQPIYGDVDDDSFAYNASVGSYNASVFAGQPLYLVFQASDTGIYRISVTSDKDVTVGYYGLPMFVQSTHRADGEYDGKSFEIEIQDFATPYVFGLKSDVDADATLVIERVGNAPFNEHYLPWDEVLPTEEFKEFTTNNLVDVDITASKLSLTPGDDGYYYIGNKLVYVRITTASKYMDASLWLIAGFENQNIGQNVGGYVYDENGEFVGKYSYNTMIGAYGEHCDANGVYPLTAELAEGIKLHGESTGWWNPNAANFLFSEVNYNAEYAWLFLCCVEQ